MSHECPDCGLTCFCGGDVNDCLANYPDEINHCGHCHENDDDFEYDDWEDWDETSGFKNVMPDPK